VLKRLQNTKLYYYTPAVTWGVLILYFSLLPHHQVPESLLSIDDLLMHAGIYGLFSFFAVWGRYCQQGQQNPHSRFLVLLLLFTSLGGGAIELIQENLIVGRRGEWADAIANTTGAFLGMVIAILTTHLYQKQKAS
jgi:VanZ family protein